MSKKRYLLQDEDFDSLMKEIERDPQLTTNEIRDEYDRLRYNALYKLLRHRVFSWIQDMRRD